MAYTAFAGFQQVGRGEAAEIAAAARAHPGAALLIFDDETGRQVDLDLRESVPTAATEGPRARGRPRLGVTAREVTLLPRHWDWLAQQPGGASATLRRLVEDARKANGDRDRERRARDAAYAFMSAIGGDLPGFEESARSLFRGDRTGLEMRIAGWPADVRAHVLALAAGT